MQGDAKVAHEILHRKAPTQITSIMKTMPQQFVKKMVGSVQMTSEGPERRRARAHLLMHVTGSLILAVTSICGVCGCTFTHCCFERACIEEVLS
jgi:hypothetical protein